MATLVELQDYVRTQTETTDAELPDSTIRQYLREAFTRTISAETEWPFYEQTWAPIQVAGQFSMPKPPDVDGIASLIDPSNYDYRLTMVDYDKAEDLYWRVTANPDYCVDYSLWGDQIYLWPQTTFAEDRTYRMRGYRKSKDWVTDNSDPDCDPRLHIPLAHYAIALAYAQQEADGLEDQYMKRWQADVELVRRAIMDPQHQRPLVMGPTRFTPIGARRYRPSYAWDLP